MVGFQNSLGSACSRNSVFCGEKWRAGKGSLYPSLLLPSFILEVGWGGVYKHPPSPFDKTRPYNRAQLSAGNLGFELEMGDMLGIGIVTRNGLILLIFLMLVGCFELVWLGLDRIILFFVKLLSFEKLLLFEICCRLWNCCRLWDCCQYFKIKWKENMDLGLFAVGTSSSSSS